MRDDHVNFHGAPPSPTMKAPSPTCGGELGWGRGVGPGPHLEPPGRSGFAHPARATPDPGIPAIRGGKSGSGASCYPCRHAPDPCRNQAPTRATAALDRQHGGAGRVPAGRGLFPSDHPAVQRMSAPDRQHPGQLWPSADYQLQVERLRSAVGRTVYLVEVAASPITLGVRQTGEPHILLDVIDFARPDPARGLAPHMIVLDDGRGINLGQLVRVSVDRAYGPSADQTLYLDRELQQQLLLRKRRLSRAFIARHARLLLGHVLGQTEPPPPPSLEADQDWRDRTALAGEQDHRKEAEPRHDDQNDDQSQGKILEGEPVAHRQRFRQ